MTRRREERSGRRVSWSPREFEALGQDISNRGKRKQEILDALAVCQYTDRAHWSDQRNP